MSKVIHLVAPLITSSVISNDSFWKTKAVWNSMTNGLVHLSDRQKAKGVLIVHSPPFDYIKDYGVTLGAALNASTRCEVWLQTHMPSSSDYQFYASLTPPKFGNAIQTEMRNWLKEGAPSQKLQSLLYRIRDKDLRLKLRQLVLQHIAGRIDLSTYVGETTLPSFLGKFLEEESTLKVMQKISNGDTSSFECRYVLQSLNAFEK